MPIFHGSQTGACPHCGVVSHYGFRRETLINVQARDNERIIPRPGPHGTTEPRPKVLVHEHEKTITVCRACGAEVEIHRPG